MTVVPTNPLPSWVNPQTVPGYIGTAKAGPVIDFIEDYLSKNCASADEYNELLKVYGEMKREIGELRAQNAELRQTLKSYTDMVTDATTKYHTEMRKRMKLEKLLEHLERKEKK